MSSSAYSRDDNTADERFRYLLVRHLDGILSETEIVEFNELLASEPRYRAELVAFGLHAYLVASRVTTNAQFDVSASAVSLPPVIEKQPVLGFLGNTLGAVGRPAFWSILGVGFVLYGTFGLIVWQMGVASLRPQAPPVEIVERIAPETNKPVAILTAADDCRWQNAGDPITFALRNGLKLYVSSNLELVSGTAELEFGDGAKVILEGPTKLVIDGASRGRLSHGKLYAKVPPRAAGFTIQTPASTIVDLGTEFGVEVDRLGREQIHVFKGRVQLATTKFNDDGQAVVSSIELDAGQAALVEPQAPGIRAIAADERQFSARGFQVENLIDDAELIVGPAYVRDVVASRPLAYWRFENEQNGWVRNEMGSRWPVRLNGVRLVGPEENRHAAFQDNAFKQWIEPEGRLDGLQGDAFSIELWVKPQRFADAELVLGYDGEGSNETASLALSLLGEGNETTPEKRLRFLHRNPPGPEDGVNAFSEATYALQRWHYLVAVKRGAEMSLYVNGKLVGSASDPTSLGRAQHLLIGRLATEFKSEPQPPRQLVGDLDEIAIYNRALSEEVIQRRFELVRDGPAP